MLDAKTWNQRFIGGIMFFCCGGISVLDWWLIKKWLPQYLAKHKVAGTACDDTV